MNQPSIYMYYPSWSPLPPPSPPDPSGSSQCTRPKHLSHASNLGWWSVSPYIIYMFQCCSLETSHHRYITLLKCWLVNWLVGWFRERFSPLRNLPNWTCQNQVSSTSCKASCQNSDIPAEGSHSHTQLTAIYLKTFKGQGGIVQLWTFHFYQDHRY